MPDLPCLDAHAHFDPSRTSDELAEAGAVELGCYFSVHSAGARRWRAFSLGTALPHPGTTRASAGESEHGWADPPGAIPHRVIWVEYLLSASLEVNVREVRQLVWQNFSRLPD